MRPVKLQHQAVITGDVVGSRRLSSEHFAAVQETILRGGASIRERFPAEVPLPLELFRGDGWQVLVTEPASAFRIALYLRAFLRAEADADTRFSIGVGPIDAMPARSVTAGRGEAFRLSGEMLDRKFPADMRFAIAGGDPGAERVSQAVEAILFILDVIVRRWTSAQGRAVCGALLGWTQDKIAASWPGEPITQQAAGQHLARAGWDGVREAVAFYEDALRRWISR